MVSWTTSPTDRPLLDSGSRMILPAPKPYSPSDKLPSQGGREGLCTTGNVVQSLPSRVYKKEIASLRSPQ